MVITASLTIPMSGAFTLNLDDPDIPYIEETPKQPSVPPRRQRQRSISGCSEGLFKQLLTFQYNFYKEETRGLGGRHGSDSAVGSSTTLSGDQMPSSPPSWASTPPASPDSTVTAVSYIPDQQAVLQRVSFTTSSEIRQVNRSTSQETPRSAVPPHPPSITSIGGAVMRYLYQPELYNHYLRASSHCIPRSKTADIERMLHITRPEIDYTISQSKNTSTTSSENKKYTKRRYTDSRHLTRHIPDSDTLSRKTTVPAVTTSSTSTTITQQSQQRSSTTQSVWKRRELISSAPKDRDNYF